MGKQACTISRMVPTNKEASPLTVRRLTSHVSLSRTLRDVPRPNSAPPHSLPQECWRMTCMDNASPPTRPDWELEAWPTM